MTCLQWGPQEPTALSVERGWLLSIDTGTRGVERVIYLMFVKIFLPLAFPAALT